MMDIVDKKTRSRMMSGIRGKNTKPELLIRKGLFRKGFRYRLHDKNLPGKPDLVFPKFKAVVFIHGCFWHGHDCHLFKWPSTRRDFWKTKITRNQSIDAHNYKTLKKGGWRVLTIWECSIKGKNRLGVENVVEQAANWLEYGKRERVIKGAN